MKDHKLHFCDKLVENVFVNCNFCDQDFFLKAHIRHINVIRQLIGDNNSPEMKFLPNWMYSIRCKWPNGFVNTLTD